MKQKNLLYWGCFIFLIGILEFFSSTSWSATYYVDYVGGDNSNNGLSEGVPKKTVPTNLVGGDIVYLKRGVTYAASLNIANSGTVRTYGTNASVSSGGTVLTVSGETFQTKGVTTGDKVYINGEGLFNISSVDSQTQITLSSSTLHKSLSNVAYLISNPITITIKTTWGSGSAVLTGGPGINVSNRSTILVDGAVTNGIEIKNNNSWGIYASGSFRGLFFRNLYIHNNGNVPNGGIDISTSGGGYIHYILIENCEIENIGNFDQYEQSVDNDIMIKSGAAYATISGNQLHDGSADGVQLYDCYECYVQSNYIYNHLLQGPHSDGIQIGGTTQGNVYIRYNRIRDNTQNIHLSIWDDSKRTLTPAYTNAIVYNNILYDTVAGSPGNFNIQVDWGSVAKMYNNIMAFGYYGPLKVYNRYPGYAVGSVAINNIFYEDGDGGPGALLEWENTNGATLDHNIYIRKNLPVSNDLLVKWGASKYTLAQMRSNFGMETHGKQCTAARCDWTWGSPAVFADPTRSNPNFHPAASNSPQVGAGVSLGLQYDINGVVLGNPITIGAFQYTGIGYTGTASSVPLPPADLTIK